VLRDRDRWRERIEISLDSKQIFLLFCASAVVVSLVFALGVVVGKRLRPEVATEPRMDPLTLLDQFAGEPEYSANRVDLTRALSDAGAASDAAGKPGIARGAADAAPKRPPSREEGAPEQGDYALQLSSFQDRVEAELFIRKLRARGLEPRIVPAQIPGRGLWYRVRLGSYESWEEAVAAKDAFEREHGAIAYVARQ
jgi:DedD protein